MSKIAFALREEFAGTVTVYEDDDDPGTEVPAFTGGLVNLGDGSEEHTLDLRKALDEGDGLIVVAEDADPRALLALDEHPALKRVAAGDAEVDVDRYDGLDRAVLVAELKTRELDATGKTGELRDRLRADDAEAEAKAAAGDNPDTGAGDGDQG